MRKGVPKAHNAIEIEMPMIRSSMESELQFIAAGATAGVGRWNETRSKILNDSSGCFMHLTRNMISRSSNQYISGSSCSAISLDL